MHSNNFELNDDADSILYTDDRLTLIEMQIDEEIEPFMDDTFLAKKSALSTNQLFRKILLTKTKRFYNPLFIGCPDLTRFGFEINVGKRRIRHK